MPFGQVAANPLPGVSLLTGWHQGGAPSRACCFVLCQEVRLLDHAVHIDLLGTPMPPLAYSAIQLGTIWAAQLSSTDKAGTLQALPYCWMLFVVPMHFLTFELLLFATGIWTTNIHDCLDGK